MTSAERVYELVKDMPPNQISEILNFAEFIKQKSTSKNSEASTTNSKEPQLQPLMVSKGYVPDGWKDAIYSSSDSSANA